MIKTRIRLNTSVHVNVLNCKIMMNSHCSQGSLQIESITAICTICEGHTDHYHFFMITVLRNITFSLLPVNPSKHQLFVSGGIFQIAIFIRPWESEPGRKREASVSPLSLPVTFHLSHPSLRWDLSSKSNVCLPRVSFFHFIVFLLTRTTNYLSVAQRSTNKRSCV